MIKSYPPVSKGSDTVLERLPWVDYYFHSVHTHSDRTFALPDVS